MFEETLKTVPHNNDNFVDEKKKHANDAPANLPSRRKSSVLRRTCFACLPVKNNSRGRRKTFYHECDWPVLCQQVKEGDITDVSCSEWLFRSCQKDVAPRYCSQKQATLFNTNALSAHVISLPIERVASVHLSFHQRFLRNCVVPLATF